MPSNNALTALGLDITQFETAANKTDHLTRVMAHGFELVDSAVRKIPIVGSLYAATIGRMVDESAELVRSGREISKIMETDVSRSLHGAVGQIDDITEALQKLNKVSISRSVYDFWVLLKTRGHQDNAAIRDANAVNLVEKRTALIQKSVELTAQEENSRSAIAAGSEVEAERTRLRLDYENKILRAQEEFNKFPKDKREQAVIDRLKEQKEIYKEVYDRELEAIETRFAARQEELRTSVKIAEIHFKGNERDIAAEELKLAIRRQQLAEQGGTAEDQANAARDAKVAKSNSDLAQRNYDLTVAQLTIETKLIEAKVTGQTRAANQLEIQARYALQITEATRRGNSELAKQLAAQQRISQLQEGIRQYELGGHGRAAERRQERHSARTARVVQSRLTERELDQRIGNQGPGSGLRAGGLTSGGLARPKQSVTQPKQVPMTEVQNFMKQVVDALTK